MTRPNIVLFCTDQQRLDSLGCYGNRVACTPNLDRIAQRGATLTRHIAPVQVCAPSRGSMLTGLYPRSHGLVCNGMALDPAVPTVAQAFRSHGYRTHGIGKFHLQPLLAGAEWNMPESVAFWQSPDNPDWNGPYYGFDTVEFVLGDGHETVEGGHYARSEGGGRFWQVFGRMPEHATRASLVGRPPWPVVSPT